MNNKEASEIILNQLKSWGYKLYNIKYSDRYFIFEMGKDGVVQFQIKGFKHWIFGMWIDTKPNKSNDDTTENYAVQFFCQYKESIDKFKPSCSYFVANYTMHDIMHPTENEFYQIRSILKMIKRHPFISYEYDLYSYSDYFEKSFIFEYIKNRTKCFIRRCNHFLKQCFTLQERD
jgi:hypothetical protein